MKKKLAAIIAAFMAIISVAALAACDQGEATIEYTLSEDSTYYIVSGVSGSKTALGVAEIPATYGENNLPVTQIGYEAFKGCTGLYSVTLPEGITSIGIRAFMQCAFRTFTIPETVTSIGYAAFGMCKGLTEITIPTAVTNLESYAFAYCSSLTKAVVKAQIEDLGFRVFAGSYATSGSNQFTDSVLTELYLPVTLKSYNAYATYGVVLNNLTVYYAGSEEEWGKIMFYQYTATDNKDENGNTIYEKEEMESTSALGSATINYNVNF
jgi:hypothetical protein